MIYDLSKEGQVDLVFECTPTVDLYSQRFVTMMWASYMRPEDSLLWDGGRPDGWVTVGEDIGKDFEVGTVSYVAVPNLPYEEGEQTLNLIEHPRKKFITPFDYGFINGDHDLKTISDELLYLVLFDQTDPIRFAMWNFCPDETGDPDSNSPAWDWQYVIWDAEMGESYGYRARVMVKPFKGTEQIWEEYRRRSEDLGVELPGPPVNDILR